MQPKIKLENPDIFDEKLDASIQFDFPNYVIIKKIYTYNNHNCKKYEITINGVVISNGSIENTTDSYAEIDITNNARSSQSVIIRLYEGNFFNF